MKKHWRSGTPIMFDGNYFRATGEAMWFAFFRELGLNVHYESQKFDLRNGLYIPDLWIADWDLHIEIKSKFEWADKLRYEEFAHSRSQCFLLLVGRPEVGLYKAFVYQRRWRVLEDGHFAEVPERYGGIAILNSKGESFPLAWNVGVRQVPDARMHSRKIRKAFDRTAGRFKSPEKRTMGSARTAPRVFREKEHISPWKETDEAPEPPAGEVGVIDPAACMDFDPNESAGDQRAD
jgi:hypothetical protein